MKLITKKERNGDINKSAKKFSYFHTRNKVFIYEIFYIVLIYKNGLRFTKKTFIDMQLH